MVRVWMSFLILLVALPACQNKENIIYEEDFNYPDGELPVLWWSEGCEASILDGHLFVNADTQMPKVSTVWLNMELRGNVEITFDAHIISSQDTANNINAFFMYSDPNGSLISSTSERREGTYSSYHSLNGYIFTNVRNGEEKVRFRFRDNPGFHLLDEKFMKLEGSDTQHIKIVKSEARIQYWANDQKIFDFEEDEFNPIHRSGYFGFRPWHTSLWWDNFKVVDLN